jgi:hypothetical protein
MHVSCESWMLGFFLIEPSYSAFSQGIKESGFKVTGISYEMDLSDLDKLLPISCASASLISISREKSCKLLL